MVQVYMGRSLSNEHEVVTITLEEKTDSGCVVDFLINMVGIGRV